MGRGRRRLLHLFSARAGESAAREKTGRCFRAGAKDARDHRSRPRRSRALRIRLAAYYAETFCPSVGSIPISRRKPEVRSLSKPTFLMLVTTVVCISRLNNLRNIV